MKFPVLAAAAAAFALSLAPLAMAAHTKGPEKKANAVKTNVVSRWPAENVSGSIDMVDPSQQLLIVKGDRTIFDFVVTPHTRIIEGGKRVTLAQLSSKDKDQVKVHFVPERKGDVAASIDLSE